ncbi:unnamed protein product [Mytilus edulis]|uniref:Uncharacterized protein n=1 Tax=Mytilus edulis TaxID=6550 RepID=A0A8S3T6S4_MYTED|nr:unnamed protein product [Mytilus edulis]
MSEYCFDTKTATILDSLLQVVQDLQHRFVKFEQQMEKIIVMQSTVNLLAEKVNYVEKHLECAMNRSNEIEGSIENIGHVMHKVVDRCKENILNITSLETAVVQHKDHSEKLDSKLRNMEDDAIELKWRSMKTNLIFTGIQFHPEENTEDKLNSFIKQKLKIDKRVNFVCVHRFGKRGHRGNRPILAKFVSIKDKEIVLKNGYKLKETQFGVKEQFPKEIEQQRKPLYPVAKQARKGKRKVRMVRDKLYIDGDLYKPNTEGVGNKM